MLRTSWLLILYLVFLGLGVTTPFVMTLGYVWVDTFQPQSVAYFILNELPVAFIMGAAAVVSYLALDRRAPPPIMTPTICQVLLCLWMTLTLLWADLPDRAWAKWDWAFKTMAFAAFIPFVIRSRIQIEAFVQTYVFSLAANFVPFGLKVLVSGGGYGTNLGLQGGNGGLAEGGLLSTICLMAAPLALYLGKHGRLVPKLPMMKFAYGCVAFLAVTTALGTYERSALVGLVMMGFWMWLRSRRKMLFGMLGVIGLVGLLAFAAKGWDARIQTIDQYNTESSALTRVLIWKWTINYASEHPFGGSFDAYGNSTIMMPPDAANPGGWVQMGRAYHSIWFEYLGDLGYPGLAMFLIAAASSMISLLMLSRKCRKIPELTWVADMSDALQAGMIAFFASGTFVGIGFQPPFWYFVAITVSLRAYVYRVQRAEATQTTGWRLVARRTREAVVSNSIGWQHPETVPEPGGASPKPWRGRAGAR